MMLRKKIKDKDSTLIEILKKAQIQNFKDDEDYKRLEATVRKYLAEFKTQMKE